MIEPFGRVCGEDYLKYLCVRAADCVAASGSEPEQLVWQCDECIPKDSFVTDSDTVLQRGNVISRPGHATVSSHFTWQLWQFASNAGRFQQLETLLQLLLIASTQGGMTDLAQVARLFAIIVPV